MCQCGTAFWDVWRMDKDIENPLGIRPFGHILPSMELLQSEIALGPDSRCVSCQLSWRSVAAIGQSKIQTTVNK